MLAIDCTYSSQDSCLQYGEVLRFEWPHDARDLYKISYSSPSPAEATAATTTAKKTYSFTHEYETRYAALGSWSLKPGSKCLFQRPRLNLNYCDLFGLGSTERGSRDEEVGDGHSKVSECCFLCEADVTTLGSAKKGSMHEHDHGHGQHMEAVEGGLLDAGSLRGSSVIDRGYEAALGAVYPNILLDM
jgi:hypothetical protein